MLWFPNVLKFIRKPRTGTLMGVVELRMEMLKPHR